jgi:hypothetical protein
MKLYLLSQDENRGYDTYDSMVVAAETEQEASLINPDGEIYNDEFYEWSKWRSWANNPKKVIVVYLGEAKQGTERGVICSSFNAG